MIAERMAQALQPGDLRLLRGPRMGRAEYLIAMGWVGIHHKTASAVYHLAMTFDPGQFQPALEAVTKKVRNMAARRGWDESPKQQVELAKKALLFVLFPACPSCRGRKFQEVPGTGRLSDRVCLACHGSGHRRIHSKRLAEVIYEIAEFEAEMIGGVRKVTR